MGTTSPASSEILLMSEDRINRSINRIAYQIAEENRDEADILIVGIKERGFEVARLLAGYLSSLTDRKVSLYQYTVDSGMEEDFENGDAEFRYMVLVDDVIFSGQTMFTALESMMRKVEPTIVRTAALVDRGHRQLPVEAAFVGLELPTKLDEHVQMLTEPGLVKKVVLKNSSD